MDKYNGQPNSLGDANDNTDEIIVLNEEQNYSSQAETLILSDSDTGNDDDDDILIINFDENEVIFFKYI